MATNKYYAYSLPKGEKGIVVSWDECSEIVKGKTGARFKGFKAKKEAEEWLSGGALYSVKKKAAPGIYFDAGTGRGDGVEISVTDESGKDLLSEVMHKKLVNIHGKHLLPKGKTNNYGELLACLYAMEIAMKKGVKNIFGDSKLVIEYWSKGHIKKKEVDPDTVSLSMEVATYRKRFEMEDGEISRISGDDNPADLGFHR